MRKSMIAYLCVIMAVFGGVGCSDDDDASDACDTCNLTKIESRLSACIDACQPDCAELSEIECQEATDICIDKCDGCGLGLQCARRRGDGKALCYENDNPLHLCVL